MKPFVHDRTKKYLKVILFGDEHCLEGVESALFLFVRDEDPALLAVEGTVNAGHRPELGEDVPDIAFRQALIINKRDGVVSKFVGLRDKNENRTCQMQINTNFQTNVYYLPNFLIINMKILLYTCI